MTGGTAHLDDVVLAILSHFRNRSESFTANREELHRAFHRLKGQFPHELSQLTFRHKGFFPESLGLDQALANLEASGLLHRMNEAPLLYEIDAGIGPSFERFAKKRLEDRGLTAELADQMASGLSRELETAVVPA